MKYLLPILFIGILFTNCKKDEFLSYEEQLALDTTIIKEYLAQNNLTATEGNFGVYYLIEEEGEGTATPTGASIVIVKYKGYLPNGDVFDQGDAYQTSLQNVIGGWQVGIPYFKKGGKGKLFIPSGLGYGVRGTNGIPGNQVLIFDIELLNFN